MDKETEKRLDAVSEDEVRRGYRLKSVPERIKNMIVSEGGTEIAKVRFTRLNPARRRKIAEVVQRQYHRDLRNPDILSHEQVLKLVTDRGEWSIEQTTLMQNLQETVNRRMGILYFSKTSDNAVDELWAKAQEYRDYVVAHGDKDQQEDILATFSRWVDYTPDAKEYFDKTHAPLQNRTTYSLDADLQRLLVSTPGTIPRELLETLEALRDKVYDLVVLQRDRVRLMELQTKYAKIFSDSAEQRRDNAEEMARMYFTTERVDEKDAPTGPLTTAFDELYNLPEDAVQWFLVESYFFQNGIPDEAREYLETVGFLTAEGEATDKASPSSASVVSAESPAPPSFKAGSEDADTTPVASSESPTATSSMTPSSL